MIHDMTCGDDLAGNQLGVAALAVGVTGVAGDGAGGVRLVLDDGAAHVIGGVLGGDQSGELSLALGVREILVANGTVPVLDSTGVLAGGGDGGYVSGGVSGRNGLTILELGVAAIAVSVAGVAGDGAVGIGGVFHVDAANMVGGILGSNQSGEFSLALGICKVLAANGAVPVLDSAGVLAGRRNSVHMTHDMTCRDDLAGNQLGIAAQAVGVAGVAGDGAGGVRLVLNGGAAHVIGSVLGGDQSGELSLAGLVSKVLAANGAVPVLGSTGVLAGGGDSFHMVHGVTSRDNRARDQLGIAAQAVGVAGITGDGAGGVRLVLDDGAAHVIGSVLGGDQSGKLGLAGLVSKVLAADGAVPVLGSAGVLAGGGDGVHVDRGVRFGRVGAGGQLNAAAQAVGVAGVTVALAGGIDAIPNLRAANMVGGIDLRLDIRQLSGAGSVRKLQVALGADPVFHIAFALAGGCQGIHVGHVMGMSVVAVEMDLELAAGIIVAAAYVAGNIRVINDGFQIALQPGQEGVRVAGDINAGKQVGVVQHGTDGVHVAAGHLAAVDFKVIRSGSRAGRSGDPMNRLDDGVVFQDLFGGDVEIGVISAVIAVVPSQIHMIILTVDLDQVPHVRLAFAGAKNHIAGDADLKQEMLECAGVAFADGLTLYQSAIGVVRIGGGHIGDFVGQIVMQVNFFSEIIHVGRDAGQSLLRCGIESGTSGSQLVAGQCVSEEYVLDLALTEFVIIRAQPEEFGVVVTVDFPHEIQFVRGNGMGLVREGDGLLTGRNGGIQGVIGPYQVFAVFHGGKCAEPIALRGGGRPHLSGDEGQHHDQGDQKSCQSLGFGSIHGGSPFIDCKRSVK